MTHVHITSNERSPHCPRFKVHYPLQWAVLMMLIRTWLGPEALALNVGWT